MVKNKSRFLVISIQKHTQNIHLTKYILSVWSLLMSQSIPFCTDSCSFEGIFIGFNGHSFGVCCVLV